MKVQLPENSKRNRPRKAPQPPMESKAWPLTENPSKEEPIGERLNPHRERRQRSWRITIVGKNTGWWEEMSEQLEGSGWMGTQMNDGDDGWIDGWLR